MKISKLFFNKYLILALIIVVGFLVRLYKIDNPIADWHSWRQADTAAVARNFYKEGFNPLIPKDDDMTGIAEDPIPNPNRYRFVEFPIYSSLVYFAYLINGGIDEKLARMVNIIFSLGSIIFIFVITQRYFKTYTALVASFLFAFIPYNIYYSRTILPEPSLVFFSLGSFYYLNRWIFENSKKVLILSLFFTVAALLTKPQAIFFLIPLAYSYYQKEGKLWPIPKRYYFFIISAIIPFIFWRIWILQHPEGIPASSWLLNGNGIRFKPIFWKWIIEDRLCREILGPTGFVLLFIGILKRWEAKEGPLLHLLAFSSLLFLLVFATGNVQHDYYQVFIVPALVIFTARGFVLLISGIKDFICRIITIPIAILFLFLIIYLGWGQIKSLYQINNGVIVEAGNYANKILPKDAIVIAPYNGDTAFLYQINRIGWSTITYPIEYLIKNYKCSHYISINYDNKTNWVLRNFNVIEKNPRFMIADLTKRNNNSNIINDPEPN